MEKCHLCMFADQHAHARIFVDVDLDSKLQHDKGSPAEYGP